MKNILIPIAILLSAGVHAQYYYNDIVGTREITERMKLYADKKVHTVVATGYDPQGRKSTDFNEWQEVKENGKALKITTRNGFDKTVLYYRFDVDGKLISLIDSTPGVHSVSLYKYDAGNHLVLIEDKTSDTSISLNDTEQRHWIYGSNGKPEKLWRVLNGKDSIEIRFTVDENGNVADERMFKEGDTGDPIYYYYDDNNRLSDIVRFNKKVNRLLPDYMFEHDEQNRVIQKITTIGSMTYKGRPILKIDYLIWRYIYNDKGLKTKEALFDKEKQLTGRIDYAYTFRQ